jgi:hypothetical protein
VTSACVLGCSMRGWLGVAYRVREGVADHERGHGCRCSSVGQRQLVERLRGGWLAGLKMGKGQRGKSW